MTNQKIIITLPHKFEPRSYQLEALEALDSGTKRAVICWARGLGKDLFAMNFLIKKAMEVPGVYLHCFPNYNQAKRAIWKSVHMTHDGESIAYLDHIPKELVRNKNSSEMMVTLKNGSIYCVMGLDGKNAMRARGMNPSFVILSEYAFMDPESWRTLEPRVKQNHGTAIFLSTPNGQNHFYELYNYAKSDPKHYYSSLVTVADAKTLDDEDIQQLRREGVPEDFIQQEYFCSFKRGAEGSYYGKLIQKARDEERIAYIPIIPDLPVHTSWDIGIGDSTAIWFFQALRNGTYNFINYYENTGEGLGHYVKYLNDFKAENQVQYGTHFVPHDMQNKEFTSGVDRIQTARDFGYDMTIVPRKGIDEGIQAARSILPLCSFEAKKCLHGVKCLDFYRKKWNESLKIYYNEPLHDKWSHGCFIAGTQIETEKGSIDISTIRVGDKVLTPNGYKKVLNVFEYQSDQLLEVKTTYSNLVCTHNHKIFTDKSLSYADALRYNDIVFTLEDIDLCQKKYGSLFGEKDLGWRENFLSGTTEDLLFSTDSSLEKTELIIEEKMDHYTGMYGCTIMDRSQKVSIFTMLTEIRKTIQKKILSQFHHLITADSTETKRKEEHNLEQQSLLLCKRLKNGTHLQKVENGIENTESSVLQKEKNLPANVEIVRTFSRATGLTPNIVTITASNNNEENSKKTTKKDYVPFVSNNSGQTNGVPRQHVLKTVPYKDKDTQKVYDLEVEHDHCYYANGILVSNSDAFRYACVGIKAIGFETSRPDDDIKAINAYWGR